MRQYKNAERTGTAEGPAAPKGAGTSQSAAGLPDLLDLDLETLRELDHPVLSEMLEGLRTRLGEPTEMLWGFDSAF
ncbi:FxSxx-COOH cyclophane-containing RiPP peptide [Streptomyces sp. SPB162]|uniref:FxSxx-COOH cyclophane-containing RiPP peptide n=1 Tax=Streptomyces sp. SPB162 TaxID=2940560 RepID=UPI002406749B|nr:FxSxx-COOH cyclophane-containing RiPP peptide [Streptomyces sp. SPB162]MDF9815585.1 FXSXX-COOH protein [Streptomyces sp. SPB162]